MQPNASSASDEDWAAAAPQVASTLLPPRFDFLYEARVRLGEFTPASGRYPGGYERATMTLDGGEFRGPSLRGRILPSTKDWPVFYGNGVRLTDVDYVFETEDGYRLFVSARGYRYDAKEMSDTLRATELVEPAANALRVTVTIRAPEDSPYGWLNWNLFYGTGGQGGLGNTDRTAVLRVYRLL